MQLMKRSYVGFMHSLAGFELFKKFTKKAREDDPYGWRRWAGSLLAIYDTKTMVSLDLPWWNVAVTREVERFLESRPDARIFEYGAGASTAWLARRAGEVISVEHDAGFADDFREMLVGFPNARLMQRGIEDGPPAYVGAIEEVDGSFDLIVVDGRHREACLQAAISHLKPGGMVLFDDSGRARYRSAIENCGLVERHHYGRSFCVPYPDHTSLLGLNV